MSHSVTSGAEIGLWFKLFHDCSKNLYLSPNGNTAFECLRLMRLQLSVLKAISHFIGLTRGEIWAVQCLYALSYIISTGLREGACALSGYPREGQTSVWGLGDMHAYVCECKCVCVCAWPCVCVCFWTWIASDRGVPRRDSWEDMGGGYRLHVFSLPWFFFDCPTATMQ